MKKYKVLRKLKKLKQHNYYSKMLLTFLSTVILLTTVSAVVLFSYFRKVMLNTINDTNMNIVAQISYGKEYMDLQADNLGNTFLSNNYLISAMTSTTYNPLITQKALKELNAVLIANKNIESIYFYNSKIEKFTSSKSGEVSDKKSFYDQEIISILKNFDYKDTGKLFPRIITYGKHKSGVYTYVYMLNSDKSIQEQSAIVINIRMDFLTEMIANLSERGTYEQERIISLNKEGIVVNCIDKEEYLKDYSRYPYVKRILELNKPSGTWIGENELGKKYVFTFSKISDGSWTFISMMPYMQAFSKVKETTVYFTLICILILVVAFGSALWASRRLYHPIAKLSEHITSKSKSTDRDSRNELEMVSHIFDEVFDSVHLLETQKRSNMYQLRSTCIRKIITGEWKVCDRNVLSECEKYEVQSLCNNHQPKALIYIKIDHYKDILEKYSSAERDTYYFALINITNEILGESYSNQGVVLSHGEFCFVVEVQEEDHQTYLQKITEYAKKIQDVVKEFMDFDISIIIGETRRIRDSFKNSFDTIKELAQYTFIKGTCSIIDYKDFEMVDNEYYLVEWKQERALSEALKLGKADTANRAYLEISDEAARHSYDNIMNTYFYLAYALYNECCLNVDKEKYNFAFMFMPFIGNLSQMSNKDEVDASFKILFEEIVECFKELNSKKNGNIIEQIKKIIQEGYKDPNICLNEIAQKINKSPSYVGRVFKEKTNKSVAEYILDVRMEEIKRLLDETELPLNTIVESVGMEKTNYFYTLFRKYFGVTITAYDRKKKEQ